MDTSAAVKTALLLCMSTLAACALDSADADLEGGEELDVSTSQTESAATTCAAPSIAGAAITRQISHVDEPVVDITIITLSDLPYKWNLSNVTGGPIGAVIFNRFTSCTNNGAGRYRCAHTFSISPGRACYASGNYVLTVKSQTDGTSCAGYDQTLQNIPFSIQTENMCAFDVDGVVDGY